MGKSALPPGFRFNPTDVELVQYYLKRKILGKQIHVKVVADVDITKWAPWDLPDKSCWQNGDLKWYFFSPIEKKYASGGRLKRATDCGYWKTTGKDRAVLYNSEGVGWIKTLIFHTGRAPRGERTNWVLHEYRLDDKKLADKGIVQDSYVLCILFQKDGIGPRCNKQYGAPFNEEDWTDDEVETDAVSHVNMSETNLVHTAMLEPEPNLTHSYTGELEIVQANTQGQLLVSTNNTQPHHGYGNVSDPYLVYQNMPQSDSHHASSDPFPSQPSSEPFLSQPSSEPFLSQPSSEPFPSQPSSEPFHSQPSSEPFLSHPSLEPFLCQPSSEPYLSHPGNYNSSITRTISHEPCISDILPSSNVLQPVSSNNVNVATDLVSPDNEISAMLDYFTEETPFSMDHDICEEVGTLVYSRDANLTADTGGCDYTAKGLGESSKTGYNIPNGAISGAPTENEPYLEVFDLDKPLNGDNSLFPMINPLRPFGGEHYEDDSFFPWRDDL